jgi:hypothetical protein
MTPERHICTYLGLRTGPCNDCERVRVANAVEASERKMKVYLRLELTRKQVDLLDELTVGRLLGEEYKDELPMWRKVKDALDAGLEEARARKRARENRYRSREALSAKTGLVSQPMKRKTP